MDRDLQIRERIAKAIQEADDLPCPENYAGQHGFGDHDWLSDWGAFLADHVKETLKQAGYTIVPMYRCETCGKGFQTPKDKKRHRDDVHTPHLKLSSKDRPENLGDIPCGVDDCNQTFANKWNAIQHRRAVHGVSVLAPGYHDADAAPLPLTKGER